MSIDKIANELSNYATVEENVPMVMIGKITGFQFLKK